MKQQYTWKALLIPINLSKEILIQDRRGFKEPDWGFFGGGIELWETPIQAVVREAKEELDIDIWEKELTFIWELGLKWNQDLIPRYFFLYKTEQKDFTVLEWNWAYWVSFDSAKNILDNRERFDEIVKNILSTLDS